MKHIKTIYKAFIILIFISACSEEENLDFLENIAPPTNVETIFKITQDNSGVVTIIPTAKGAVSFDVHFGDTTLEPAKLEQGTTVDHIYMEGNYDVTVIAYNSVGKSIEILLPLVIPLFKAPQNLVVTLENDTAVSKQLNITTTAEFASTYEFYSGEASVSQPAAIANIGDVINYQYTEIGVYDIKIIANSGGIATTEYATSFEVTQILAPLTSAPIPKTRDAGDVVSIFSDKYTDVSLSELPTTWSAGGLAETAVNGDNIWKLTNLDYIGIVTNYASGIDLSSMEKMHIDYWVPEGVTNELLVKLVNTTLAPIQEAVASLGTTIGGSWQSIEVDMLLFNAGNLSNKNKITQILIDVLELDGISVVYIDNFYFYKN
jgi:hypothetical protein